MRSFRSRKGPFDRQPYYALAEIEKTCLEALDGLGLLPASPEPIRIDRFVERHFKISPSYERLPDGVLGFTRFGVDGVREIVVSTSLDEEGGQVNERRIRTTLAHEAGHGLLHAHLFAGGKKPASLFDDENDRPEILCRGDHGPSSDHRYDGRWWEFQANKAIGGLLMPRILVVQAAESFCEPQGLLGLLSLVEEKRDQAARSLSDVFDINPVVARLRLEDIFPRSGQTQLTL